MEIIKSTPSFVNADLASQQQKELHSQGKPNFKGRVLMVGGSNNGYETLFSLLCIVAYADLSSDVAITWGGDRAKQSGNYLQLSLDRHSGLGFQSKAQYLYRRVDMDMKLVPGNSAGTVTTLYLSSQGKYHDEIDFEFVGNASGQPYTLHTNVYSRGKGDREQQFYLWFDPRADFHKYSILWNPQQIIFYVDDTPIRVFQNHESIGVPYPKSQPMRLYSSLWDAENWATQGGRVKTNWKLAPFVASYKNFKADACFWYAGKSMCPKTTGTWWGQSLDETEMQRLKWVQKNYMIYNYCVDYKRFPQGFPPECSIETSP